MSRILAAALLAAAVMARPAGASEPFQIVTLDAVEKMLGAKDVVVYDANPEEVYERNHLPGARFVGRDFGPKTLPSDKATRLVFYCSNPR